MTWLLMGVLIWVALAVPLALLIGRSIRLADGRHSAARRNPPEANVVATGELPGEVRPADGEQPWQGPSTVPFAPSRLPWGGDRSSPPRPRPAVVRHPVAPHERDPRARDNGQA